MYPDQERQIFGPFRNGQVNEAGEPIQVYGDPLAINRRLIHVLGDNPNQVVDDFNHKEDEAANFEANEVILKACKAAFPGLAPFDYLTGYGLMEDEIIDLFRTFQKFCAKKKGSGVNSPTPLPTASNQDSACATPTGSGSG